MLGRNTIANSADVARSLVHSRARTLRDVALQTSPEDPAPLHVITEAITAWIARLSPVWVEGQVTQINRRPGANQVFLQLRDLEKNASITMVTSPSILDAVVPALTDGARVVLHARAEFWTGRGTLVLRAREIRAVGLGDLLARIERLKAQLAAEGLFAPARKRPLPFLPRRVGLVCGRESAAMKDVIENARRRWPSVDFEIREVVVQGTAAVRAVTQAVRELDAYDDIDVIVITRGGGSVEDLLAFSDEALVRAVSDCVTPIISAIGHEQDAPLLDYVADFRASTPTDAARHIVPDLNEEVEKVLALRTRALRAISTSLDAEQLRIANWAAHPSLADPSARMAAESELVSSQHVRSSRALLVQLRTASDTVDHLHARLRALSPAATLDRGYAIVETADGNVVRDPIAVAPGDLLTARVAMGRFDVVVSSKTA